MNPLTYYDYFKTTYHNFNKIPLEALNRQDQETNLKPEYERHNHALMNIIKRTRDEHIENQETQSHDLKVEIYNFIEDNNNLSVFDNQTHFFDFNRRKDGDSTNVDFFNYIKEHEPFTLSGEENKIKIFQDILSVKKDENILSMKTIEVIDINNTLDEETPIDDVIGEEACDGGISIPCCGSG